jgi:HEAT repeat protein
LQALRVIGLCDIAGVLAEQILPCCQDSDPHVRSAAVKLLGHVPGGQSEQTVREALVDPDRRVRANAVEAIESQQSGSAIGDLTAMQEDRDNRIRANAIKALMAMNFAEARDNLMRMLADPSPEHRLSALWVVERIGWLKPALQVLQLAQRDGDRRIRCRALRTLGELRRVYQAGKGAGAGSQDAARPAGAIGPGRSEVAP